jgi:hypothetical protein
VASPNASLTSGNTGGTRGQHAYHAATSTRATRTNAGFSVSLQANGAFDGRANLRFDLVYV